MILSRTVIVSGLRAVCAAKSRTCGIAMHGDEVASSPLRTTQPVPRNDMAGNGSALLKIAVMVFLCLSLSTVAFAQSRDTTHADTAKKFMIVDASAPSKASMPLIILNGKIYKRNIKTIDTSKIKSIDILKGKDAAKYGPKGKNGVIVITTKD